ncbi:MAG: S16 family serine protease [Candidatus Bathyarchaeia archaeon]
MEQPEPLEKKPQRDRRQVMKVIVAASLIVNVALAFSVVSMYHEVTQLNNQLSVLIDQNWNLTRRLDLTQQKNELLENQVDFYRRQAEYYQRQLEREDAALGLTGASTINAVGVVELYQVPYTTSYKGATMKLDVELHVGSGRILVNTEPRVGIDLQSSTRTAAIVAENYTGISLEKTDVIITVKAEEEVNVVDGPSAGVALTAAIIAAISNQTINQQIYATGTINPDGTIGKVGGVLYKAVAAAEEGASKFLVPRGQKIVTISVQERREIAPNFTLIITRQEAVDLQEYLQQSGYFVEVIEVDTIMDAYSILISG